MFHPVKSLPTLFFGLVLAVLGGIPLLHNFGIIPFGLPSFIAGYTAGIIIFLIAAGGLYLILDSFMEFGAMSHGIAWLTLFAGLVFLTIGLIPILNSYGIIPFGLPFGIGAMLSNIIFLIEAVFLIIATFLVD